MIWKINCSNDFLIGLLSAQEWEIFERFPRCPPAARGIDRIQQKEIMF
jgi:hypothetical protein